MNRPDLVITFIKHCDYPLFRVFLRKYRDHFNKVIIYWSEHNRFPYLDHFIHEAIKDLDITFIDPTLTDWGTEDWRNHATNEMLKYSDSEWICSIEQDWFSSNWEELFEITFKAMETNDLIGWDAQAGDGGRYIHPAFWFIRREMLEKTNKDFAAHDNLDHFGFITRDVDRSSLISPRRS